MKYMNLEEFRRLGYLQELNRRLLHPLGLALAVGVDDHGHEMFVGIWDEREDPDGIVFADPPDADKVAFVDAELERRRLAREFLLGDLVQRAGPPPQGLLS